DYVFRIFLKGFPGEPAQLGTDAEGTTINSGTLINARLTNTVTVGSPPAVAISRPGDLEQFTYTVGSGVMNIPVEITGTAADDYPVTGLTLNVEGHGDIDIAGVVTGLGTGFAAANVSLPYSNPVAGFYTVAATATNSKGTAETNLEFEIVRQVPPPAISITAPLSPDVHVYTFTRGLEAGVSVPFTIPASTLADGGTNEGIQTLTATVDSLPLALTGWTVGGLNVTGTSSRFITEPGVYTVHAETSTVHGT